MRVAMQTVGVLSLCMRIVGVKVIRVEIVLLVFSSRYGASGGDKRSLEAHSPCLWCS
jgi:hypothetical protein